MCVCVSECVCVLLARGWAEQEPRALTKEAQRTGSWELVVEPL